MTLAELYPYLSDTHEELLEKLSLLSDDEWTRRACPPSTLTIRTIIARAVERERQLILVIAQGRPQRSASLAMDGLSNEDLLSDLAATRVVTERYAASLSPATLRSVRAVPADAERNIPESNMPLAYVLWSVVENEIAALAAVTQLQQLGKSER